MRINPINFRHDFKHDSGRSLRAAFMLCQPHQVLFEITIELTGGDNDSGSMHHLSRIIDDYLLNVSTEDGASDLVWYQLIALAKRCHEQAQLASAKVATTISITAGEEPEYIAEVTGTSGAFKRTAASSHQSPVRRWPRLVRAIE